jgi:hypothetical protein
VDHPDRKLGRHPIQILLGRVPPFLQHRIVVTDTQDVLVLGGQPSQPGPERREHLFDAADRARRRRRQVDPVQLARHLRELPVAVDEAGDQGPATEIEQAGPRPGRLQHVTDLADGEDATAAHRDRLGEGAAFVHRHHVGVHEHSRGLTPPSRHLI